MLQYLFTTLDPVSIRHVLNLPDSESENSEDEKTEMEDDSIPEMEEWKPETEDLIEDKLIPGRRNDREKSGSSAILPAPPPDVRSSTGSGIHVKKESSTFDSASGSWKPEIDFKPDAFPVLDHRDHDEWKPDLDEEGEEDDEMPEMEELEPGSDSHNI